jgi:SEC-C motif-containing protein
MRSRYSAFALGDAAYLERTWHSSTRPLRLDLDPATRWTRLEILGRTGGGPFHTEGTVEFRAFFREHGRAEQSMRESSAFVRENGAWVYLSAL